MKISKLAIVACAAILLLNACSSIANSSFGPIKQDNFAEVFADSIKTQQAEIIFYSRAIWYANKNGFKFLPAGKKSRRGVFVCTTKGIYFSEWKANAYQTAFNADYNQIADLRLAANDLFGRLVVKTDLYNSFEVLGVAGPDLPDKDETEVAYQLIATQKDL